MRLFIAIEPPKNVLDDLEKIKKSLDVFGKSVKWVSPQGIHLTLKFLGETPDARVADIKKAIIKGSKGCAPLSLQAMGLSVFPFMENPKVIWTGVSGDLKKLEDLHASIEAALVEEGFARDDNPFRGHFTLGRVKKQIDSKKLGDLFKEHGTYDSGIFTADQITLFKSDLDHKGAIYTPVETVKLSKTN